MAFVRALRRNEGGKAYAAILRAADAASNEFVDLSPNGLEGNIETTRQLANADRRWVDIRPIV